MADPDRFAALAPICGTGISWNAGTLAKLPIYVYHGDIDPTVPILESINMVSWVNRKGGHAQIKILHGVGHNAWDTADGTDELLNWMLQQRRVTPDGV